MIPTQSRVAARRAAHRRQDSLCGRPTRRRRRCGISVVLVVIVLVVLIAFASLAVDVGRVRVAKVQLQTAADAAATAAASGMEMFPARGVLEPEERAVRAAGENLAIDQTAGDGRRSNSAVDLFPDEDMIFGRWNDVTREFTRIEGSSGPMDRRRQADAIRVWTRRVTRFEDPEGNVVDRGTALQLIFAPVIGVQKGEIQAEATAVLKSNVDTAAFVGLQYVRFTGAMRSDSYDAASGETYPGAGGPNRNTSIASNDEIYFSGTSTVLGSVYPGINKWIQPQPLASNVTITGYMFPLSRVMSAAPPAFGLPQRYNEPNSIQPLEVLEYDEGVQHPRYEPGNNDNDVKLVSQVQSQPGASTHFVFSRWSTGRRDFVIIDNSNSPIDIWVQGDFDHESTARIDIKSAHHPVTFHVHGNMDLLALITQPGSLPRVRILMSGNNTRLRMGGSLSLFAHVTAPLSDISFTGNGRSSYHFFGRAFGKSMTVASNVELHYDESLGPINPLFAIRLVE